MTTLGSCTVASATQGEGHLMIQRRIEGRSWAEIAQEFNLKGPSAARTRFTKLTGITDYKIKGQALKQLVDSDMLDSIKQAAVKKADKIVKEMDAVVPESPITPFSPKPDELGDAIKTWKQFNDTPKAAVEEKFEKSVDDLILEGLEKEKKQQLAVSKDAYGKTAGNMVDSYHNVHGVDTWEKVWDTHKSGQGYTYIVQQSGKSFKDVDQYIWNRLLKEADGNIFKALEGKPNSEIGVKFVKEKIAAMKAKGWSDFDIIKYWDIDTSKININNIKDPLPPMVGGNSYASPKPQYSGGTGSTPQQAKVHFDETHQYSGFTKAQETEMNEWHERSPQMQSDTFSYYKRYTGSSYHEYNAYNRFGTGNYREAVDAIDRGFLPLPRDVRLIRNVDESAFPEAVQNMGGKVFQDKSWMSTSIDGSAFSGRRVQMILDVPAGTPARWVDPFSSVKGEKEVLLGRGLKWIITKVEEVPGYGKKFEVHMKLISDGST